MHSLFLTGLRPAPVPSGPDPAHSLMMLLYLWAIVLAKKPEGLWLNVLPPHSTFLFPASLVFPQSLVSIRHDSTCKVKGSTTYLSVNRVPGFHRPTCRSPRSKCYYVFQRFDWISVAWRDFTINSSRNGSATGITQRLASRESHAMRGENDA